MSTHLIAGCGYLGHRVAQRWLADGRDVAALTRNSERAAKLNGEGISPIVGDITDRDSLTNLPPADVVLFAVGFDRQAGHSIEEVYVKGLANLLDALPQSPQRFIYISSTGVYGQSDGSWVDESTLCEPTRAGGKACWAAEQLLRESAAASQIVILRSAGLYGPGRIPRLADVESQKPIRANPDVWLNLIHIDDLADLVVQVAATTPPSDLYAVADGEPVKRREFYDCLAKVKGLQPPTFAPADELSGRRAGGDNKRVSNRRLVSELQPQFAFPTFRAGLAAIET